MKKQLGGGRIGGGGKMNVELKEFPYSTHSLSTIRRTSTAVGVVVPVFTQICLPEDTWDMDLNVEVLTLPANGPAFGSMIVDLHTFESPVRLYNGDLHMNALEIGNDMSKIKLPRIRIEVDRGTATLLEQIEPSSLLAHLDIMGIGRASNGTGFHNRYFMALPLLAYYDINKCYYANKQETNAYIVHTPVPIINQTVTQVRVVEGGAFITPDVPFQPVEASTPLTYDPQLRIDYSGTLPNYETIWVKVNGKIYNATDVWSARTAPAGNSFLYTSIKPQFQYTYIQSWGYTTSSIPAPSQPKLTAFPLKNIDEMKIRLMKWTGSATSFNIVPSTNLAPYSTILEAESISRRTSLQYPLEGLMVKTYQSDINNNWLKTEWIDSVNDRSKVLTTGGSFTMNALNMAKKVYDLLNTVALAGGTYDDWIETVWSTENIQRAESPIYHGGLRKELAFQEVVATTAATTGSGQTAQPLGQLGGRGKMTGTHKGGKVKFKTREIGIVQVMMSITPRIDYTQGNAWWVNLTSVDDFHKPQLDGIGFQDLIEDTMAYWSTDIDISMNPTFKSAGKQPAWINYQTNINTARGTFAQPDKDMFMIFARRYEQDNVLGIKDMTTYIDPAKFNYLFADASISAQNYWAHVGIKCEVRRKMSAKLIPNF